MQFRKKLFLLTLLSWHCFANSQSVNLNQRVNLSLQNTFLLEALHHIEAQTTIKFSYSEDVINLKAKITLTVSQQSLSNTLNKLFANTNIQWF